jgi:hypothetical protein
VALLFLVSCLACTVADFGRFLPIGNGTAGCYGGDLSLMTYPPSRIWSLIPAEGGCHAPRFGTGFEYRRDEEWLTVNVPIWCPLALLATWIAFREWRRKRAAKGKLCRQ